LPILEQINIIYIRALAAFTSYSPVHKLFTTKDIKVYYSLYIKK